MILKLEAFFKDYKKLRRFEFFSYKVVLIDINIDNI